MASLVRSNHLLHFKIFFEQNLIPISFRYCSNHKKPSPSPSATNVLKDKSASSSAKSEPIKQQNELNVTGFSSKVLNVPNQEVGCGALKTGKYKNAEYFCYNAESYFEAEIEMLKFRLPQPKAK